MALENEILNGNGDIVGNIGADKMKDSGGDTVELSFRRIIRNNNIRRN